MHFFRKILKFSFPFAFLLFTAFSPGAAIVVWEVLIITAGQKENEFSGSRCNAFVSLPFRAALALFDNLFPLIETNLTST